MNRITIPTGYRPVLDEYDTQRAIEHIKRTFQREFAAALNLKRSRHLCSSPAHPD